MNTRKRKCVHTKYVFAVKFDLMRCEPVACQGKGSVDDYSNCQEMNPKKSPKMKRKEKKRKERGTGISPAIHEGMNIQFDERLLKEGG